MFKNFIEVKSTRHEANHCRAYSPGHPASGNPHLCLHAREPVWLGPCVGILCNRAACEVHPVTRVALAPSFHHYTVFSCVAISQLTLSPDGQRMVSRFSLSPISLPPRAHTGASPGCQARSRAAVPWAECSSRFEASPKCSSRWC